MSQDTLMLGQIVPDFTLDTYDPVKEDFGTYELAKNRKAGKWSLLFFYPGDFTFVCATEFNALAEHQDELLKMNTELVTVSCDTKFVHLAWRRDEGELKGVRYAMGADPTGRIARMFGVYDEGSGMALRGTFLLNPEGRLLSSEVAWYNVGRNVEELVRKVRANQHCASHAGEACPAKWTNEGDKTLKNAGAKMVGKVHEALKG